MLALSLCITFLFGVFAACSSLPGIIDQAFLKITENCKSARANYIRNVRNKYDSLVTAKVRSMNGNMAFDITPQEDQINQVFEAAREVDLISGKKGDFLPLILRHSLKIR